MEKMSFFLLFIRLQGHIYEVVFRFRAHWRGETYTYVRMDNIYEDCLFISKSQAIPSSFFKSFCSNTKGENLLSILLNEVLQQFSVKYRCKSVTSMLAGDVVGAQRSTIFPSLSTINLVKFHLMLPPKRLPLLDFRNL